MRIDHGIRAYIAMVKSVWYCLLVVVYIFLNCEHVLCVVPLSRAD